MKKILILPLLTIPEFQIESSDSKAIPKEKKNEKEY
jgi:hypothetical protein